MRTRNLDKQVDAKLSRTTKRALAAIQEVARVGRVEARDIARKIAKISTAVEQYFPEMTPFDYQRDYLDDMQTRFLIWKKARQVGFSQTSAYKGIVKAISMPHYTKLFISLSLEDAKEKINYANMLYERIASSCGKSVPRKITDNRMEIELSNGSRLISLFTPRGKAKSDIDLDEFAFHQSPRKLWQSAAPIMIHPGSRMSIASTPLHSFTMFHAMFEGDGNKYNQFTRKKIYWWDCPIHCHDVEDARKRIIFEKTGDRMMDTETCVDVFGTASLKELYDGMVKVDFQQEFELMEIDDDASLLPWDLIVRRTPTGEEALEKCDSIETLYEKTMQQNLYAGFDVGRHKDSSELSVFAEQDGVLVERYFLTLQTASFSTQEDFLRKLMNLPNVLKLGIDKTGMGEQIAERMEQSYGTRISPIHFSAPMKASLATQTKMYMEKDKVTFIANPERSYQMHSIKKKVTDHGNIQYVAATGKVDAIGGHKHHGDVFWSRALAIYCHAELHNFGTPRIRFL